MWILIISPQRLWGVITGTIAESIRQIQNAILAAKSAFIDAEYYEYQTREALRERDSPYKKFLLVKKQKD